MKTPKLYRAKVSSQGQITLPVELRTQLKKDKGDYITLSYTNGSLIVGAEPNISAYLGKINVYGGHSPEEVHKKYKDTFNRD